MKDVSIRAAKLSDATGCAAILNDWIDETPWMPRLHTPQDVERHYRETILPERTVFIAKTIDTPFAGFMALDPVGYITALYCRPRGQGTGSALLRHAKSLRSDWKLWTFEANKSAHRLYEREGFVAVHRTDGDNEEGLPDILYQWSRP